MTFKIGILGLTNAAAPESVVNSAAINAIAPTELRLGS
jgi:hypothetical protein